MVEVQAIKSFTHGELKVKKHDQIPVTEHTARQLELNKLVIRVANIRPIVPVGKKSHVLPAGQALPQATAKKSKRGAAKKAVAQFL